MIRTHKIDPIFGDISTPENGREVDPFTDSETVRLVAVNLELAVRNLISANAPPESLVVTADIGTQKIMLSQPRMATLRCSCSNSSHGECNGPGVYPGSLRSPRRSTVRKYV